MKVLKIVFLPFFVLVKAIDRLRIFIELELKALYYRSICINVPGDTKIYYPYSDKTRSEEPLESERFYNFLGRLFLYWSQICALIFSKKQKKILVESFDTIDYKSLYSQGGKDRLYPPSPLFEMPLGKDEISENLLKRLQRSYDMAYEHDPERIDNSAWWRKEIDGFKKAFFHADNTIKIEMLRNFRGIYTGTDAAILRDNFERVHPDKGYVYSYMKALDLVMDYHMFARFVDHTVLKSISESFCGNNKCFVYRGQRLSRRLLNNSYYYSRIIKNVECGANDEITIMDLGGGYGGTLRMLCKYYHKARGMIVELPEMCLFAGYFLTHCFPEKKVGVLADIDINMLKKGKYDFKEFDIYVLPTWSIQFVPADSVQVLLNTFSLAEMSIKYGQFYIEHIERIVTDYFYSNNKSGIRKGQYEDFNFFHWPFKKKWRSIIHGYSFTGHLEWLGRIIK